MDQNLINYIKQNKQQGFSDEEIKKALLDAGWEQEDIDQGFKNISEPIIPEPAPVQPTPSINKLPGPIALLKDAWGIYKSRFWVFVGIALIPVLLTALAIIIGTLSGVSFFLISSLFELTLVKIILLVLLAILLAFIISLVQIWGQGSLIYAVKDKEEKINIIQAYKRAGYKLFSLFWISILVGFITLGGFMLLIIPGIIFSIWFSLAIYILVAENLKGMTALLKSKGYVKENWWKVLGRFIFIGLIVLIVSLIIEGILYFIKIPDLGKSIINSLISLLFAPLIIIYTFLIYKNLKALKGEFVFTPTKKKKVSFIVIAIIGLLLIPGLIFGIVFISLNQAREKAKEAAEEAKERMLELEQQYQQEMEFPGGFPDTEEIPEQTSPPTQQPLSGTSKARDDQRWTDLGVLSTLLEIYLEENGHYPKVTGCTDIYFSGLADTLTTIKSMSVTKEELPKDPSNVGEYIYLYSSDGTTYVLRALFEDPANQWLNYDQDGNIMACPCDDPAFCIKSE